MRVGSRTFAPRLWAVLLYVALLSCMLWLGNWQLERAALKVSLQDAAEAARQAEAVPLHTLSDLELAAARYQRVSLSGRYDVERQFLWDNRTYNGQAGYEVISMLQLDAGGVALINRGWTAPGPSRQLFPDVTLPDAINDERIFIEGYVSRPSKGFASGDAVEGDNRWPKLVQYFDYEAIAKVLGEPIIPVVVQAQALGTDSKSATVLTSRPEWLTANWQPAASGPAKHYSYAFQWFAMALALTGIFLVVNTRKHAPEDLEQDSINR